ncbi:CoA transferase [Dehalococcoidia bacterium]|nr:CoA transferase [Dehalococcoidia bacterium]
MAGPLEGVKVLEIANWVAAPSTGATLAELGAQVIKVEPPKTGDPQRFRTTSTTGFMVTWTGGVNMAFQQFNRGKLSVGIDLETPSGRDLVGRLANQTDVLLTNLVPARQERYHLRYEDLAARNERIIYIAVTGYGMEGSEKNGLGFDYSCFWARSGIMGTIGDPNSPPVTLRPGQGDQVASLAADAAIGIALFERERSGKGQRIDCSLIHSGLWTIALDVVAAFQAKKAVDQVSRRSVPNPLNNTYRASDGRWLHLMSGGPLWSNVCQALGLNKLRLDPRFDSPELREANNRPLIEIIDATIAAQPLSHWAQRLDAEGCTWCSVKTLEEVARDDQILENSYVESIKDTNDGLFPYVTSPMKFQRSHPVPMAPAPEAGQHTEEVLLDAGYSWDEIANLKRDGAIV